MVCVRRGGRCFFSKDLRKRQFKLRRQPHSSFHPLPPLFRVYHEEGGGVSNALMRASFRLLVSLIHHHASVLPSSSSLPWGGGAKKGRKEETFPPFLVAQGAAATPELSLPLKRKEECLSSSPLPPHHAPSVKCLLLLKSPWDRRGGGRASLLSRTRGGAVVALRSLAIRKHRIAEE